MHQHFPMRRFTSFFTRGLCLPMWRSALLLLLLGWCFGATASTFTLAHDRWETLVIPANPEGRTVADLLGDDLPESAVYGTDWAVYTYNPQTRAYNHSSPDQQLFQGQAFWIIQLTNEPVILDMPDDLAAADYSESAACTSEEGCFEIALPADPALPAGTVGQRYALIGAPYDFTSDLTDIRLQTDVDGDACEPGCDFTQSAAQNYTPDHVWIYDDAATNPHYIDAGIGYAVGPWQGYWIAALQALEGKSPYLLLPYSAPEATLAGRVTTPDGQPVVEAAVLANNNADSAVAFTDEKGHFELTLAAGMQYTLTVETGAHADQIQMIRTPAQGQTLRLDITLLNIGDTTSFAAHAGADITAANGASVALMADSFVDADGQPVTGSIDVTMTSVDVSNPATLAAFPGDFDGIDTAGSATPIISLGTTHFAFTQAGQPVQLAASATADINIPIFSDSYQNGNPVTVGDSIPLWSLNEATGIWQQEGSGTVVAEAKSPTGLALSATVTHFSWWNCDVTMNAVQVRIAVSGSGQGSSVISATASGDLGWRPTSVSTMISIGMRTPPLFVPSGREVCYSAEITYIDGTTAVTDQQCLTRPAGSPQFDINLSAPNASATLAIGTNIAPGADGTVVINGHAGAPISRLSLLPLSIESSVTYTLSGTLPTGLVLQGMPATGAEIVGVPASGSAGSYDVDVTASNDQGESDSVTVRYVIDNVLIPPELRNTYPILFGIYIDSTSQTFSLSSLNIGGPVSSWEFLSDTGQPLPPGLTFDAATEELHVVNADYFAAGGDEWNGTLTATNAAGSSTATVIIREDEFDIFPGE